MPPSAPSRTRGSVALRREVGDLSVTEARHAPGSTLPLHAHPVPCAVLVLAGGFVETLDRGTWSCRPGDVLLRPAGAAHANRYGDHGASYLVVELPDTVLAALEDPEDVLSRIRLARTERARVLTRRVRAASRESDRILKAEVRSALFGLLDAIACGADEPPAGAGPGDSPSAWLERVHDRVCERFRDRPSLDELAADAGVHPDHVSRAFREHFGFTINDLVRRCRVECAAGAIRTTELGLARVAYEAGFSDQSHMTRQMRRHLGVTPAELRRL